jgi:8-oxo-dGTP diphosphatase
VAAVNSQTGPGRDEPESGPDNEAVAGRVVQCVGALIRHQDGRLLLILRGHDPGAGLWSLPGGRIEPGETDQQAVVREIAEETGLTVTCGGLVGTATLPGLGTDTVVVRDYRAVVVGGELAAGDDAAQARWVDEAELASLPLTAGLLEFLREWDHHTGQ